MRHGFLLVLTGLVSLLVLANAQVSLQGPRPAPDATPAVPAEADDAAAVRIALADAEVQSLLQGRTQVIGASALPDAKDATGAAVGARLMEVQVYRYAFADTVLAQVSLRDRAVAAVSVEKYEPVVVLDELLVAKQHLLADGRVAAALGGDVADVELIHARLHADDGACAAQRCLLTSFVRWDGADPLDQEPVPGVAALFNLATLETVEVRA